MTKRGQNTMPFAVKLETGRLFANDENLDQAVEKYLEGEEAMASGELDLMAELRSTNEKLDALVDVLSDQAGSRPRRRGRGRDREDEPESVRDMQDRGRQGEASQVAFEIKVPVGRDGASLKGLLIFDVPIRHDRDLEELADEVDRKFRLANVFKKQDYGNRGGYGGGNGYGGGGYNRGYDRDRDWRR